MELRFGDITIACTHVDRVVFAGAGLTKGDVIAYYADVAVAMLPELAGRALTLERFTKGIEAGASIGVIRGTTCVQLLPP